MASSKSSENTANLDEGLLDFIAVAFSGGNTIIESNRISLENKSGKIEVENIDTDPPILCARQVTESQPIAFTTPLISLL